MLSARDRLSKKEVESLSKGTSVFGTLVSMRYRPAGETKISVSVPKKVAKSAVDRNRIRRRTYAAARSLLPSVEAAAHIMIFPKKEFRTERLDSMRDRLAELFRKARLGSF